jgi:hypothetical protein
MKKFISKFENKNEIQTGKESNSSFIGKSFKFSRENVVVEEVLAEGTLNGFLQ